MADQSSPDALLIRDIVQAAIELACIRHDLCFYDEPPLVVEQCAEIVTDVFNALRGIDTCDPEPCPEFSAILAALEDRQEAAPHVGGVCPKCHWFICQCQVPGVPSEATPSKEKAANCGLCGKEMKASGQIVHGHAIYFCCNRAFAAPAPEVQGTLEDSARLVSTTSRAGQNDACLEPVLSVRADTGGPASFEEMATDEVYQHESIAMAEGTLQKETPPAKCPYCDFNEGLGHAKFCRNYQVTRGSSMPYGADAQNFGAVPEGVQGKEPQTPGRCPQCNSDKRWVRNITAIPVDGAETNSECCHPWHDTGTSPKYEPLDGATCDVRARDFHARFSPISLQELQAFQSYERNDAFGSGEAAGRRSAITEMQEWAETWESGVCVTDTRKISAKCAEFRADAGPRNGNSRGRR